MEIIGDAQRPPSDMSAEDVGWFLDLADRLDIGVWLDGGWGVDALLGAQTRRHGDLDIVVEQKDVAALREALATYGFVDSPTDDRTDWNFVVADPAGRRLDFHVVVIDEEGNGIYGPVENGLVYPASALAGSGSVGGRPVRCLTPEYQVKSHTGYELDEDDIRDVVALHERFGVPLSEEHRRTLGRG